MAVLGQVLTAPEAGWRRIDDNDSRINYTLANLTAYSGGTSYYNNTIHFNWSESTGKIKFRFFGSKLRLICSNATYTFGQHTITIDGVTENIYKMGATTIYQFLAYEKTGLPETSHDVEITLNGGNFGLDAIDVDSVNGSLTVPIGSVLTTPDTGWQRFDDSENKINYINFNGKNYTQSGNYGTGLSYSTSADASIIIKFYGTKFRYITQLNTVVSGRTPSVDIVVDGIIHTITTHLGNPTSIVLAFEKSNLSPGIHTVTIKRTGTDSGNFALDALDIDSDGYLVAQPGVGMQLTAPEPGWKRIDDTDTRISLTDLSGQYTGKGRVNGSAYNSTDTQFTSGKAIFKFKGTKLRITGMISTVGAGGYSNDVSIKIDSLPIEKFSNGGTAKYQVLLYEKTGLDNIIHTVEISNNLSGAYVNIDALDIDGDMAGIGVTLSSPEPGWKRYDDIDNKISSNLISQADAGYYGSTAKYNTAIDSYVKFKFKGTKFRFIGALWNTNSNNIEVKIDGSVIESFSQYSASLTSKQILNYEKFDLSDTVHEVVITSKVASNFSFDAIDVDGYLVHPILNQVSKIEDMKIGDCIPVRYKVTTSGTVGVFSEIGTCVATEIPYTSSATPDGMFFFIKVAKGLLIADRVIQHSIAWDVLNSGKLIEGGAEALIGTVKYRIRSLSGGSSFIDANGNRSTTDKSLGGYPENNDFNKYLMKSTLDGKITAGDTNIWHPNLSSFVKETPSIDLIRASDSVVGKATDRVYRGLMGMAFVPVTAYTVTWLGFRPALEFLEADAKAQNMYY